MTKIDAYVSMNSSDLAKRIDEIYSQLSEYSIKVLDWQEPFEAQKRKFDFANNSYIFHTRKIYKGSIFSYYHSYMFRNPIRCILNEIQSVRNYLKELDNMCSLGETVMLSPTDANKIQSFSVDLMVPNLSDFPKIMARNRVLIERIECETQSIKETYEELKAVESPYLTKGESGNVEIRQTPQEPSCGMIFAILFAVGVIALGVAALVSGG